MNKKSMLFLSLLVSGSASAYVIFKKMSSTKRKQLLNQFNDKAHQFKHRAVDYAFYASDAMDDAKRNFHDQTSNAKSKLQSVSHDASDLKDKFHSKFNQSDDQENKSKPAQENNSTQFHTAADHLRSELGEEDEESDNDITINANDAFTNDKKTVTFYPDGSVK